MKFLILTRRSDHSTHLNLTSQRFIKPQIHRDFLISMCNFSKLCSNDITKYTFSHLDLIKNNESCPESEMKDQDLASCRSSKVCAFLKVCDVNLQPSILCIKYDPNKSSFQLFDKTVKDENHNGQ